MVRFFLILLIVIVVLFVLFFITKTVQSRPKPLGIRDGQLLPCPDAPNCVSTTATDDLHAIAPIPFAGEPAAAYATLLEFVKKQKDVTIYEERPEAGYLRVEAMTPLMRFIDDVEFLVQDNVIHFRSGSRFGHGDMGANHQRMEAWKAELATLLPS